MCWLCEYSSKVFANFLEIYCVHRGHVSIRYRGRINMLQNICSIGPHLQKRVFKKSRLCTAGQKKGLVLPSPFPALVQSDFPPSAAIDVYCQSNLESAIAGLFHLLTKGLRIVARLNQSLAPTFRLRLC